MVRVYCKTPKQLPFEGLSQKKRKNEERYDMKE
jgi:hypothetical protein